MRFTETNGNAPLNDIQRTNSFTNSRVVGRWSLHHGALPLYIAAGANINNSPPPVRSRVNAPTGLWFHVTQPIEDEDESTAEKHPPLTWAKSPAAGWRASCWRKERLLPSWLEILTRIRRCSDFHPADPRTDWKWEVFFFSFGNPRFVNYTVPVRSLDLLSLIHYTHTRLCKNYMTKSES